MGSSPRLPELMLRDQHRLQRRLDGVRKIRDAARREAAEEQLEREIAAAEQRLASRRAGGSKNTNTGEVPVSQPGKHNLGMVWDHPAESGAGGTRAVETH